MWVALGLGLVAVAVALAFAGMALETRRLRRELHERHVARILDAAARKEDGL